MKSYPDRELAEEKEVYIYQLLGKKRFTGNTFDISAAKNLGGKYEQIFKQFFKKSLRYVYSQNYS